MHQILFRLGFHPKPRWDAHSAPQSSLQTGFKGVLLLREWKEMGGKRKGKGNEGKGEVASWLLGDGPPAGNIHVSP